MSNYVEHFSWERCQCRWCGRGWKPLHSRNCCRQSEGCQTLLWSQSSKSAVSTIHHFQTLSARWLLCHPWFPQLRSCRKQWEGFVNTFLWGGLCSQEKSFGAGTCPPCPSARWSLCLPSHGHGTREIQQVEHFCRCLSLSYDLQKQKNLLFPWLRWWSVSQSRRLLKTDIRLLENFERTMTEDYHRRQAWLPARGYGLRWANSQCLYRSYQ